MLTALSYWVTSTPVVLAESQFMRVKIKAISLVCAFALTANAVRPGEQASRTAQITLLGPRAHLQLEQAISEPDQGTSAPAAAPGPAAAASQALVASSSHRTNLCKNSAEVSDSKRSLVKGLEGTHITAVAPPGSYAHLDGDGKWSGYDVDVLKDLANRANFTFDIVPVELTKTQQSTSSQEEKHAQFVDWNKGYDLVLQHNTEESERDKSEVFQVYGQLDASLVLVTNRDPSAASTSLLQRMLVMAAPYDPSVWLVFTACCLATGVLYWFLERVSIPEVDKSDVDQPEADKSDVDEAVDTMGKSVFFAAMNCTTMISYSPRTWPGRIVLLTWSMVCVIFLAGYTANLATILVMSNQAQQQWKGLEDAIESEARICVSGGHASHRFMTAHHSGYPYTVSTKGGTEPIKAMVDGKCDAAIVWQLVYDISTIKEELNAKCNLQKVGPKLTVSSGGWSAIADYSDRCTALVRDVLHTFSQEMFEDGSFDKHYENLMATERTLATPCGPSNKTQGNSLPLAAMTGLFLLYLFGSGVACLVYFINRQVSSSPVRG